MRVWCAARASKARIRMPRQMAGQPGTVVFTMRSKAQAWPSVQAVVFCHVSVVVSPRQYPSES